MLRVVLICGTAVFTWAGIACMVGVRRFRYYPLAIPAVGYLSWVSSFLLFLGFAGPLTLPLLGTALMLSAIGGVCIVGYGLTYNRKMKGLGITPRRILGLAKAGDAAPKKLAPNQRFKLPSAED